MNWSQLTFAGYRDGRMWEAYESMLDGISQALSERSYRSPTPEGKLTLCLQASSQCLQLGYVWTRGKHDFCNAPSNWDCPWRSPSNIAAQGPQHTKYVDKGRPTPPVQEGKSKAIKAWIIRNLTDINSHAAQVQLGLDEPCTLDELKELGSEMVRRYNEQLPQKAC